MFVRSHLKNPPRPQWTTTLTPDVFYGQPNAIKIVLFRILFLKTLCFQSKLKLTTDKALQYHLKKINHTISPTFTSNHRPQLEIKSFSYVNTIRAKTKIHLSKCIFNMQRIGALKVKFLFD